jgi:hypothetical protein
MTVPALDDYRVKIRTFLVTYWANVDVNPGSEIKLGVFGDLRVGKRYALGLIARTTIGPDELERVGRLAKRLVENPYQGLHERYEEIWRAPNPAIAFERVLTRCHTSFIFSDPDQRVENAVAASVQDAEIARNWCMDKLRPVIRDRFYYWLGHLPSEVPPREQLAEREEQQDIADAVRATG